MLATRIEMGSVMNNLPVTLDAKGLSVLTHRSVATILRDVTRDKNHDRQPPHIKSGKKPIWFTHVVLTWLAGKSCESVSIKIEFDLKSTSAAVRPVLPARRTLAEDLMIASDYAETK